MNLNSSFTSSKGQTPKFNTQGSMQGVEAKLDEHIRVTTMFKHATKYSVHMTNILFILFDVEINNTHIIEEKDRSIQNLHGALEKEYTLKKKLQDKNNENSKVLAKLQATKKKINNIQKQSKDLENIKMERDSL
jgi:mevalonate kinase